MNKFFKVIISITGATNAIFSMFTPIAIALLITNMSDIQGWKLTALFIAAIISTVYRAIKIGFIE